MFGIAYLMNVTHEPVTILKVSESKAGSVELLSSSVVEPKGRGWVIAESLEENQDEPHVWDDAVPAKGAVIQPGAERYELVGELQAPTDKSSSFDGVVIDYKNSSGERFRVSSVAKMSFRPVCQ